MGSISKGKKPYNFLTKVITYLLPSILLFDWLFNLGKINIQIGLYLKALMILIFIIFLLNHKTRGFIFKNTLIYFLCLFFVYSFFSTNIIQSLYFTVRVSYWIFASLVFYYLFINNYFYEKKIRLMFLMMVAIGSFFTIQLMNQSEEHQNASAYLLLWCLPFLLKFKKSNIIKIAIAISIVAIIMTIKRGAMLALVASFITYFYGESYIGQSVKYKSKVFAGAIILLGFTALIFYLNWDFISVRFEDKSGSGRDIMYAAIIKHYLNGNFIQILFGRGINSVQRFTAIFFTGNINSHGVAAHSDWLQYIHDFGLLGLGFMVTIHIKFLKLIRFHKKLKTKLFPIILMTYTIFALTTIYSFILNTPNAIVLGILVAFFSSETNKIKYERTQTSFINL